MNAPRTGDALYEGLVQGAADPKAQLNAVVVVLDRLGLFDQVRRELFIMHAELQATEVAEMNPNYRHYPIEAGALTKVPVYEEHARGKNWFAKISADPTAPGGLSRTFATVAKGKYFYLVPAWCIPGVAVEFGADYYSRGGKKTISRWYGVIRARTEDTLTIERTPNHEAAIAASKAAGDPTP